MSTAIGGGVGDLCAARVARIRRALCAHQVCAGENGVREGAAMGAWREGAVMVAWRKTRRTTRRTARSYSDFSEPLPRIFFLPLRFAVPRGAVVGLGASVSAIVSSPLGSSLPPSS